MSARTVLTCVALLLLPSATQAQRPWRLKPHEIGQIVDVVLDSLLPDTSAVSRVPVTKRGVYLDFNRTIAEFGYGQKKPATKSEPAQNPAAPAFAISELQTHRAVKTGSVALLQDCNQAGTRPCAALGWGVYLWVQALEVTPTEAKVRAWFFWPDRGRLPFQDDVGPMSAAASLVGFWTEVLIARDASGRWKYLKKGDGRIF